MLDPVEVAVRRRELSAKLGEIRKAAGLSARDVAGSMGVSSGTPWRIESGRVDPRWSTFVLLAVRYGHVVDLDSPVPFPDGQRPGLNFIPAGYEGSGARVEMRLHPDTRWHTNDMLMWVGAEMWWARKNELDPPLGASAAARLLGINRSTLRGVEHGALQPRLSTVILVAGLAGRRLKLAPY